MAFDAIVWASPAPRATFHCRHSATWTPQYFAQLPVVRFQTMQGRAGKPAIGTLYLK
jgi:hypothetical protein